MHLPLRASKTKVPLAARRGHCAERPRSLHAPPIVRTRRRTWTRSDESAFHSGSRTNRAEVDPLVHPGLLLRRAEPPRHVRPEAERTGRGSRRVPHHRDRRSRRPRLRTPAATAPGCWIALALVRGLHHPMRNHNSAAAEALTGRTPAGGDQELLTDDPRGMPTLGSAVSYALGAARTCCPTSRCRTRSTTSCSCRGRRPGLLGGAYDRFQVERRPERARLPHRRPSTGLPTSPTARALLRGLDRSTLPGPADAGRASTATAP